MRQCDKETAFATPSLPSVPSKGGAASGTVGVPHRTQARTLHILHMPCLGGPTTGPIDAKWRHRERAITPRNEKRGAQLEICDAHGRANRTFHRRSFAAPASKERVSTHMYTALITRLVVGAWGSGLWGLLRGSGPKAGMPGGYRLYVPELPARNVYCAELSQAASHGVDASRQTST